jgi:hypothetical protein
MSDIFRPSPQSNSDLIRASGVRNSDLIRPYQGSADGTAGSQTPWASDINGAGFKLTNVASIGVSTTSPQAQIDMGLAAPGLVGAILGRSPSDGGFTLSVVNGTSTAGASGTEMNRLGLYWAGNWNCGFRFLRGGGAQDGFLAIDTNNTEQVRILGNGAIVLTNLPSTAPAAGSKQLWYDPADGNRVKFMP